MSLSQDINNYIDATVQKYIKLISTKHNLNYDELLREWTSPTSSPKQIVSASQAQAQNQPQAQAQNQAQNQPRPKTPPKKVVTGVVESKSDTTESLINLTKQELQERCKKAGVRSSGTKNDLIKYLTENKSQTKINSISTKPPPFVQQIQQEEKRMEEQKKAVVNPILKKISATIPLINIRRNKFNNFEDINTGFVFDNLSKKVIGKQSANGTVLELTKEDINICNKYKFQFVLPSNLDKNTKVEDVKVEELEEDDGEGDDEIVEEEVEVEAEVEAEVVDEEVDEDDVVDEEDEDGEMLEEEDVLEDDE